MNLIHDRTLPLTQNCRVWAGGQCLEALLFTPLIIGPEDFELPCAQSQVCGPMTMKLFVYLKGTQDLVSWGCKFSTHKVDKTFHDRTTMRAGTR